MLNIQPTKSVGAAFHKDSLEVYISFSNKFKLIYAWLNGGDWVVDVEVIDEGDLMFEIKCMFIKGKFVWDCWVWLVRVC